VELPPSLRAAHRSPLPIAMRAVDIIGSLKAPLAKALGVKAARLTLHGQDGNVLSDDATLPQAGHMQQLRLSLPGYSEGADRLIDKCLEAHAEDPDAPCTALRQQHDISAGFACIEEHGCDPITRCTGTDEPSARVLMQHTHAALDQDLNGEDIYLLQRQIDAIQTKLSQKKRELESAPPRIPPTPPTQATASRRSDALQPEASPVAPSGVVERRAAEAQREEERQRAAAKDEQGAFTLDKFEKLVLSSVEWMTPSQCFDDTVFELIESLPKGDARAVAFRAMCDQHLVDWNILIEMYDLGAKTNALFHYEYAQLLVEQMLWIAAQKLQWEHCTDAELVQNVQNQSSANFVDEWASQYDWLEQLHSSAKQLHSSATDSHLAKRPRPNPPEDEPASGLMG